MVANAAILSSNGNRTLCYGPLGSLESIPAAFSLETIVVAFAGGPTDAVLHWGDQMLTQYEKTRKGPDFDLTLTYLGYSTDNGAYYYYNTEPDMNYEDTLIAVKKYADSEHIPYKYILLDSWYAHETGKKGGGGSERERKTREKLRDERERGRDLL